MENVKILATRRYNGETYTFYLNEDISWVDGKSMQYISCKTPENCFGYPDTILLSQGKAYTLHRYLQPWIIRKAEKLMRILTIQHADINFQINNSEVKYA